MSDKIIHLFDDETLHEMSEGHTGYDDSSEEFNYDDVVESMQQFYGDESINLTKSEILDGLVYRCKALDEEGMILTVSTYRERDSLWDSMTEHINNMEAAENFKKYNPEYRTYYMKEENVNCNFYSVLNSCSDSVKDLYASMFIGVAGACEEIALMKLDIDMEVNDRNFAHFIKADGEYSDALIASLISKSCANYLPRACRPMFFNVRNASEGDVVQFVSDELPDELVSRGCNIEVSFDTDSFDNIESDFENIQGIKEQWQGFDDAVWLRAEYPMILQDNLCKIDIRRDFYNNLDVDVEVYDETPANRMFREIYRLMYEYYNAVFNDNEDKELNTYEICKQALKNILQGYNN